MTDDQIIDGVINREGGYVHHPADRGGPTKFGITLKTLEDWRGDLVTAEDVKALTLDEARDIYRQWYIHRPGFNRIKDGLLRALAVDLAVNHGQKKATQMLQLAAGVTPDSVFGPVTEKALNDMDARKAFLNACAERGILYGAIITKDPAQSAFALGWARRNAEWIRLA